MTETAPKDELRFTPVPKLSDWECYLFGSSDGHGIVYQPKEGEVPNLFVRWMMKICFGCK